MSALAQALVLLDRGEPFKNVRKRCLQLEQLIDGASAQRSNAIQLRRLAREPGAIAGDSATSAEKRGEATEAILIPEAKSRRCDVSRVTDRKERSRVGIKLAQHFREANTGAAELEREER